jgi:hypothetical protein
MARASVITLAVALAAAAALCSTVPAPAAGSLSGKYRGATVPRVELQIKSEPRQLNDPLSIAQLLTAGVAVIGSFVAFFQYRSGRKEKRSERTAKFVERYTDREFRSVASRSLSFFRVNDAAECIRKLEAHERMAHADEPCLPRSAENPAGPHASYNDVYQVFYFFEELAVAYNRGDLERVVVHEMFPDPPIQFFTEAWWYLCWAREGEWVAPKRRPRKRVLEAGETDLYSQFEWMVREIQRRVKEEEATSPPVKAGFVLCLPPEAKPKNKPDARLWSRARCYSRLLTEHAMDLEPILLQLEDKTGRCPTAKQRATSTNPSDWDVVIVPPETKEKRAAWELRRSDSRRIAHCLTLLKDQPGEIEAILGTCDQDH